MERKTRDKLRDAYFKTETMPPKRRGVFFVFPVSKDAETIQFTKRGHAYTVVSDAAGDVVCLALDEERADEIVRTMNQSGRPAR